MSSQIFTADIIHCFIVVTDKIYLHPDNKCPDMLDMLCVCVCVYVCMYTRDC